MVLSRIWSAFIIIAVLVAGFRMVAGDEKIFTRMVVGKSSDKYDSIYYSSKADNKTLVKVFDDLGPRFDEFYNDYSAFIHDFVEKAHSLNEMIENYKKTGE